MEPYQELEKKFGEWQGCDNPNTVAVSSGTSALHVALESLELPLGSEVIMPDFTMVACARAVVMAGLKPVFIDCGEDLNINPLLLKNALSHKTSAVMAVHIYGRQCAMGDIHVFAQHNGLKVIEDMAEIHGIKPHPETDAACWSFYKNKIIHGEEGGMIAFKNVENVERAVSLRSLGFTHRHDFYHIPRGVNARMSNAHAKLILESLHDYEWNALRRFELEATYEDNIPKEWQLPNRDAVWVYDVLCPRGTDTQAIVDELNTQGIAARLGFKPMCRQDEFKNCPTIRSQATGAISMTAFYSAHVIYLPVNPEMTRGRVEDYCKMLKVLLTA